MIAALPPVPLWACAPFAILLLAIATGPLVAKKAWHHFYPHVCFGLGAIVVAYYALFRNEGGHGVHLLGHVGVEYLSFVALIGSLYVVASGVVLRLRGPATTFANVFLLGGAGALANVIGTTGASMLLIRPYLRFNGKHLGTHHVVFFIFIVANIGGGLTPIGDPPLFLGYLKGIPFFWTAEHLLDPWLAAMAVMLAVFAGFDHLHAKRTGRRRSSSDRIGLEISGRRALFYLPVIVVLVLVQREPFLLELQPWSTLAAAGAMIGTATLAYRTADRETLRENEFTFEPVREVAIVFAGIFATMVPALEYLERNAATMGLAHPNDFYFATGILSAMLDNAPTYLTFLTADLGVAGLSVNDPHQVLAHISTDEGARTVAGISCGAVFFGAMTYIGNGPNFMVRSIAEAAGVKCPSFFGYVFKWAVPLLLPVLTVIGFVFFFN